jgi:hypothetical protein
MYCIIVNTVNIEINPINYRYAAPDHPGKLIAQQELHTERCSPDREVKNTRELTQAIFCLA